MATNGNKKKIKKAFRHYHFIGIGGMGMGNLALLMLAKGYAVSGSDLKEGELTRQLRERGARIHIGHDIRNLEGADCVVYSSAVTMTNPEMFHAVSQHIPVLRRAELLAELVNKEVGVTVAGAHGKTTTSSMASLLLIKAGLKPTTAIGGIVNNGEDYNANLGIGRHIVAEVDESDGSFLYFSPHFSIITNVDAEHLDYYDTFEKIKEAYAMFVERTVPGGVVVACGDDKNLRPIVEAGDRRKVFYGFGADNEWIATNIHCDANGSSYDCYHDGNMIGHFELSVPGKHNALNSLAIVALGHELKIDVSVIQETLHSFGGVKRRFQRKGDVGGVMVIDDYGHHPTEIAATLQTAKTLDRKRIITVFQPHRYTRTKFLLNEFSTCFNLTDYLILTDIYAASEKPIEGVSTAILEDKIREVCPGNLTYLKKEDIVDYLTNMVQPGDLVLTLGAGDITHISDEIVRRIEQKCREQYLLGVQVPSVERIKAFGTIGVIMGGCSSERDVSLRSGSAIAKALIDAGCVVKPMDLTSEDPDTVREWVRSFGIDVAFLAVHGRFGEDGGMQSILDDLGIPYNGCGPRASAIAFDKQEAQRFFEKKNVSVPRTITLTDSNSVDLKKITHDLGGFPLFVKPACEGSSIGISEAKDETSLKTAIDHAFKYGARVLVQQCISGKELTVGIIGETLLPVVEICSGDVFFDYQAKYKNQTTRYIVPADLSADIVVRVQEEALKAYRSLGCEGFGRVDVLLDKNNMPFVLEVNTLPGFTATSLLPKAARVAGLDFQQLCLTLVDMAYGKKKTVVAAPVIR